MNFFCIKCLMFTKDNNIKLKLKIDEKISPYSRFNEPSFQKFATIDKKERRNKE